MIVPKESEREMNTTTQISLIVNGQARRLVVESNKTLLWVLREMMGLTGTKEGCGTGECGACTVIMNGKVVNSCVVLAAAVDGANITTIEGVAEGGKLHPLQEAFLYNGGSQCGYCAPGMILTAMEILSENSDPTDDEILQGLDGNLCRCTGYVKIVESIKAAAKTMREYGASD